MKPLSRSFNLDHLKGRARKLSYMRQLTALKRSLGLPQTGSRLRHKDRNGLSKHHAAYMRVWRLEKAKALK